MRLMDRIVNRRSRRHTVTVIGFATVAVTVVLFACRDMLFARDVYWVPSSMDDLKVHLDWSGQRNPIHETQVSEEMYNMCKRLLSR